MPLFDLLIMLAAGVLIVPLAQYLKLGAVPGFLLAGIIVGPSAAGLIDNSEEIHRIGEFGVVFLLFIIGMEVNPSKLWQMRSWVFGMGALQVLVTGTALAIAGKLLFNFDNNTAALIGMALALSSTAFVMQILLERKAMQRQFARASFSILLMQDLAVVPLLAFAGFISMGEVSMNSSMLNPLAKALAVAGAVILSGRYLLQPVLNIIARSRNPEIFTATALLLVMGMAFLSQAIGLSMEMGAFIAGLLIADCSYRHQIRAEIQPFRGILLGLFFMSMGLSVNLQVLFAHPILILALTVGLIIIKSAIALPLLLLFKLNSRKSIASALLLAQSGEFALVILSQALGQNLLSQTLYQQLLLVVLCSMLATPILAKWAFDVVNKEQADGENFDINLEHSRIILAGFGRVGQRIGSILEKLDIEYIAIDKNPNTVAQAQKMGRPVFYGDATKASIFKSLEMSDDNIVLITLDDFDAAEQLVVMLSSHYPKAYTLVRGHNAKQCEILLKLGASDIVSENLEASLQLSRLALTETGMDEHQFKDVLAQYKFEYYRDIS